MTDTREDTGYTGTERRNKERVSISDYGKAALADKAKAEIEKLKEQLKPRVNQ